jgi:hypothetical protein
VYVARHLRDRKLQRALMQFFKPENHFPVREALLRAGRTSSAGGATASSRPTRRARRSRPDGSRPTRRPAASTYTRFRTPARATGRGGRRRADTRRRAGVVSPQPLRPDRRRPGNGKGCRSTCGRTIRAAPEGAARLQRGGPEGLARHRPAGRVEAAVEGPSARFSAGPGRGGVRRTDSRSGWLCLFCPR